VFRNILVCVDGSPQSDRALREAIDVADCQNSRLTILTAIVRPPAWANTPMTAAGVEPLAVELEREARQTLCRAVDLVPDCIPVTKILTEDPIRDALNEQIRAGRYDLVVLGTRGRGALAASLRGSVSHYALHHSHVPVLIVRAEEECEPDRVSAASPAKTTMPTAFNASL
jgi:nucleotide-binding universal stress UspA family protein